MCPPCVDRVRPAKGVDAPSPARTRCSHEHALRGCTPTQGVWQPAGCVSCEPVCVLCVARACRHHLSPHTSESMFMRASVHRVGVQSEPYCSSPSYMHFIHIVSAASSAVVVVIAAVFAGAPAPSPPPSIAAAIAAAIIATIIGIARTTRRCDQPPRGSQRLTLPTRECAAPSLTSSYACALRTPPRRHRVRRGG